MSSAKPHPSAEESKREESTMQQHPTAPPATPDDDDDVAVHPMGPPPTYNEAIGATPYPPTTMTSPSAARAPYPTATPYPVTDSAMPLPVAQASAATPYPVHNAGPMPVPVPEVHRSHQPVGFVDPTPPPPHAYQPIVNQPTTGAYSHHNEEYVHPKTYVVLQDDRSGRRREDEECTCTDWAMCCLCCVETCRCVMVCLECVAACNK